MTMTVQQMKRKKKLSQAFQEALDGLTLDIEKLQPRIDKVFTVGRTEGLNDKQIGKEIRKKMKGSYGRTTIWRVLEKYPDAKFEKRGSVSSKKKQTDGDKYRFYKEIIATKNKVIAELREEIADLKKRLAAKEKPKQDIEKRKQDIGAKLRAHQLKRLGETEGGEQKNE